MLNRLLLPTIACFLAAAHAAEAPKSYDEAAMLQALQTYASGPAPKSYDKAAMLQALQTYSSGPETWSILRRLVFAPDELQSQVLADAKAYFNSLPKPSKAELNQLLKTSSGNLVQFKAGEFVMGDFGLLQDPPWPVTSSDNDKPPHKVKLDAFGIMKQRVSFAEYDIYTRDQGLPPINTDKIIIGLDFRFPDYPASNLNWNQARGYCLWLGKLSGKNWDLPTEAQWEYAARAGGQEVFFSAPATMAKHVGNFAALIEPLGKKSTHPYMILPVGLLPPNAAGVYDMGGWGREWVYDYYAPYSAKAQINPRGPEQGAQRTVRLASRSISFTTLSRRSLPQDLPNTSSLERGSSDEFHNTFDVGSPGFRCALNP